ncbi:MAG: RluA family pseudouridine synthase [Eubacterium sp.]|nr:RluA family pseudouridine synthase [Eubacterium sp.]
MIELVIKESESGQRLDKFLRRYLPEAGSGFLYRMMRKKNIVLNGKKAEGRELLKPGDTIKIFFSDETIAKFKGRGLAEEGLPALKQEWILYEDSDMLVLNKPAGILSQKGEDDTPSMVEYIRGYLVKKGELTEESLRFYKPGVVNRLDRNTSGILLAAKTLAAARSLSLELKERTADKFYLAVVHGKPEKAAHAAAWLARTEADPNHKVRIADEFFEGASRIETEYEPISSGREYSLLKVRLITGKTHQIRCHLASLGYPIAGDRKYGIREAKAPKRQMLHAWKLQIEMGSNDKKTFTAPVPEDMLDFMTRDGISFAE